MDAEPILITAQQLRAIQSGMLRLVETRDHCRQQAAQAPDSERAQAYRDLEAKLNAILWIVRPHF